MHFYVEDWDKYTGACLCLSTNCSNKKVMEIVYLLFCETTRYLESLTQFPVMKAILHVKNTNWRTEVNLCRPLFYYTRRHDMQIDHLSKRRSQPSKANNNKRQLSWSITITIHHDDEVQIQGCNFRFGRRAASRHPERRVNQHCLLRGVHFRHCGVQ